MTQSPHPAVALDDTVHQRARLGVLAVPHERAQAGFVLLRETLAGTDGNPSRHVRVLEGAGYVETLALLGAAS